MKRDLKKLSATTYDLLIVGGGIYGTTAAWDAALRGLSVALIDKGDFGGATSANSLKTIHGGLRYLQQLDVKRMRESIRERMIYMRIAPHLVHPLPVVMPTYGHAMKGKEIMFAGLLMNDIISIDRNRSSDPQKKIPNGRIVSKKRCLEMVPGVDGLRVTGGAFWTDAQVYNSERFTLAFLLSSVEKGADAANYVEATELLKNGNHVTGVIAKDGLTGNTLRITAKTVLNTCGGWADKLIEQSDVKNKGKRVNLSTAMNLVVKRKLLRECAAGVSGRFAYERPNGSVYEGSRVLFMSPWRDYTIVGTFHRPYQGDPDEMTVTEDEIQSCLSEVNSAYPNHPIKREDVSFFYKGFLPMDGINEKNGEVRLTKHYRIYDHGKEGGSEGVISIVGVKYTTARDVAAKGIDRIIKKLGNQYPASTSHKERLAGGDISNFDMFMSEAINGKSDTVSETAIRHLVFNYGTLYPKLLDLEQENSDWLKPIPGSEEVIGAEIVHAVRNEMAVKLSDVVHRRTDLGSGECPAEEGLKVCASLMAKELGWDNKRIEKEIEETESVYIPVK